MQSSSWDELVAQVKQGTNAEEALGLKEPEVNVSKFLLRHRVESKPLGMVLNTHIQLQKSSGRNWW